MRVEFGKTIVRLAQKDSKIILITGDVEQEMSEFKKLFPDRFFNMGLCEQSIVSLAGGLASQGFKPVVYSITPFLLETAFEQIKIDIDYNNLPVILIGYSDYPTHGITHRPLDAEGLIKLLPNTTGYFPRNEKETSKAMIDAYLSGRPAFICLKKNPNNEQFI